MSQKTIIINSCDRIKEGNESISDFHYTIQSFTNQLKDIYVESAQLYNTSYTVDQYNSEICWQIMTGGDLLITYYLTLDSAIHFGYYNITDLINLIESQMNLTAQNGETYSITYDDLTGYVNISCDICDFTLLNTKNTLWKRVGFTNQKLGDLKTNFYDPYNDLEFEAWIIQSSYANIHWAISTPRLSTNYYKILMSGISSDTIDSKQQLQCVAIVPNNAQYGSLLDYQPKIIKKFELPSTFQLNRINFKVYDDENNLANLNTDFSLVIVGHTIDYKCGCK